MGNGRADMKTRLAIAILAALAAPASAAAQAPTIQPGDWAFTTSNGTELPCTLAWLFDGSDGKSYFASAAHCGALGSEIMTTDPTSTQPTPTEMVGKVAYRGSDGDDPGKDVALIRVRDELAARVAGELRGGAGIPAAVTSPADAAPGDLLRFSGWGIGVQHTAPTREQREGVFLEGDAFSWTGLVPVINGDSGGPVAHVASKGAFGVNKGYHCSAGTSGGGCGTWGGSVGAVERLAAANGLKLTLRLAGAPAPPQPQPQPEPQPGDQPAPGPEQPAAPATTVAVHAAKKVSAKAIKRSRRLAVTLAPSRPLENVSVLLTRGSRTFAAGTARALTSRAKVTLKVRRTVKRGRYDIVVVARDDLGRAVRAASSVKVTR